MTRKARLGISIVSTAFCITATAGPAMAERSGYCHIDGASSSKAKKKNGKKGNGKHKNGSGGKHR